MFANILKSSLIASALYLSGAQATEQRMIRVTEGIYKPVDQPAGCEGYVIPNYEEKTLTISMRSATGYRCAAAGRIIEYNMTPDEENVYLDIKGEFAALKVHSPTSLEIAYGRPFARQILILVD